MFILPKKSLQRGVVELFLLLGVASTAVAAGTALYKTLRYGTVNPIDKPETLNIHNPSLQLKTLTFISPTRPPVQTSLVACGYPYQSANPRTSLRSRENSVLLGFSPNLLGPGETLKVWYNDEHASYLGVKQIQIKTSTGTQTKDYPFTTLSGSPGSAINPQIGATALTGAEAGTDVYGRPMFPSLFISDITIDPNNKSGDWQAGGAPVPLHAIYGTWKGATKIIDTTKNPPVSTFSRTAPNPAPNRQNLGSGTDPIPQDILTAYTARFKLLAFSSEAQWQVDKLITDGHMLPGHTYRVQFMVHDGDSSQEGGDEAEGCATVRL